MSRVLTATLSMIIIVLIAGCAGSGESQNADVNRDAVHVDVDLTGLSTTVLSAEMMNIIVNSQDYLGQTIRVSGTYDFIIHEPTGEYYHYIITVLGDECCREGFEIVLNGDSIGRDNYPAVGAQIQVDGVFSRYDGSVALFRHYYLAIDDIHLE